MFGRLQNRPTSKSAVSKQALLQKKWNTYKTKESFISTP